MWYVIGGVFGLLAIAVGALYVLGRRIPANHVITATLALSASREEIHALIADIGAWNAWDSGVTKIEPLEPLAGRTRIRMFMGRNSFVLSVVESKSPSFLVLHANDDHGFFEGRWEYEISVENSRSIVTLTERGTVKPAIPRAMLKYFADPAMYLKRHLKMVAARFSEPPDIRDARRIS